MAEAANRILLARIGAPHGVRGQVRVKTFTGDPMAIGDYGALFTADGRSFSVADIRPDKAGVVARFKGVDDRNRAEALNGLDLFVERSVLPEPDDEDEFYHADLIGLAAHKADGTALGTVTGVHDHGAGEFLEIAPPRGQTLLVPFTKTAIPEIDIATGRILVEPPPEIEVSEDEARRAEKEDDAT